jgi:hypothetical protein
MNHLLLQLLIALVSGLIVSVIPFDATLKRVCYVLIGVFVLLVLLAALFGIHLLGGVA